MPPPAARSPTDTSGPTRAVCTPSPKREPPAYGAVCTRTPRENPPRTSRNRTKHFVTGGSHVVTHHSTNPAHAELTSEFGWDPVHCRRYERSMLVVTKSMVYISPRNRLNGRLAFAPGSALGQPSPPRSCSTRGAAAPGRATPGSFHHASALWRPQNAGFLPPTIALPEETPPTETSPIKWAPPRSSLNGATQSPRSG